MELVFAVPTALHSSPRLEMVSQTLTKGLIQIRLTDSGDNVIPMVYYIRHMVYYIRHVERRTRAMIKLVACDGYNDEGFQGMAEIDDERWIVFQTEKGKKPTFFDKETFYKKDYADFNAFKEQVRVWMAYRSFLNEPIPVKSLKYDDIIFVAKDKFPTLYLGKSKQSNDKARKRLAEVKK